MSEIPEYVYESLNMMKMNCKYLQYGVREDEHCSYFVNAKEVPSVTTILKMIGKPALSIWANGLGLKGINYFGHLYRLAAIGTEYHKLVELFMSKKDLPLESNYSEAVICFEQFLEWYKKHNYRTLGNEIQMVSKQYGFGGTIDAIGYLDGKCTMVDYKTSKRPQPSMFLQLSAYALLIEENMPETFDNIKQFTILANNYEKGIHVKTISKEELLEEGVPTFLSIFEAYKKWIKFNKNLFNVSDPLR